MKLAILGIRGIPANYGGFETFAEECGAGLAARGHDVTVYCRSHYVAPPRERYRGVQVGQSARQHATLAPLHDAGFYDVAFDTTTFGAEGSPNCTPPVSIRTAIEPFARATVPVMSVLMVLPPMT